MLLAFAVILGIIPSVASAASTPEEALGEVNIYSGGYSMKYLAVNGRVQTQSYTYFLREGEFWGIRGNPGLLCNTEPVWCTADGS